MLLRTLARQTLIGGQTLICTRYRHPDTKPSDQTIDISEQQRLVNLPLRKPEEKITSVTIGEIMFITFQCTFQSTLAFSSCMQTVIAIIYSAPILNVSFLPEVVTHQVVVCMLSSKRIPMKFILHDDDPVSFSARQTPSLWWCGQKAAPTRQFVETTVARGVHHRTCSSCKIWNCVS